MPPSIARLRTKASVRAGMTPSSVGILRLVREDARGVVADRTAVEQIPRFAVGVDGPGADQAGIEEIETLVGRPADLSVRLGDQHGLA